MKRERIKFSIFLLSTFLLTSLSSNFLDCQAQDRIPVLLDFLKNFNRPTRTENSNCEGEEHFGQVPSTSPSKWLTPASNELTKQLDTFLKQRMFAEDFTESQKDFASPHFQDFQKRVWNNYFQLDDLTFIQDGKVLTIPKEFLKDILSLEESEFNRLSYIERINRLSTIFKKSMEFLKYEKNKVIFKKYLKLMKPGNSEFSSFVDGISSFTDEEEIERLLTNHPEWAGEIFYKRKILNVMSKEELQSLSVVGREQMEKPKFRYGIKQGSLQLETMEYAYAPLDVIQGIYNNTSSLFSIKGVTSAFPEEMRLWKAQQVNANGDSEIQKEIQEKTARVFKRAATAFLNKNIFHSSGLNKVKRPPTIRLLEAPIKKFIPKENEDNQLVFTIKETNSAEQGGMGISIYRQEESLKTLTHEIYHTINAEKPFDHSDLAKFALDHFAIQRKDNNGSPLLAETLTEALALISNVTMTAMEVSSREKTTRVERETRAKEIVNELWKKEKDFALFQTAKLLFISGFDNLEEFLSPQLHQKRFQETTSTAEYNILKTILIYDVDAFLKSVMVGSDGRKKENNQIGEELKKLLIDNSRNPKLKEQINSLIGHFKKISESDQQDFFGHYLFQNQRMSVIEI